MAAASFAQSNFLGGEWSEAFSGRTDHPNYKKAMKLCWNAYPTAEGSLVRRSGFNFIAATRSGVAGRLIPFDFANAVPYNLELSDTHLRMFNGPSLVFNDDSVSVTAISTATPAVVTIASDMGWTTGVQIQFGIDQPGYEDKFAILQNRQFTVTKLTGTTYSIADAISGAGVDGTTVNADFSHVTVTARSVLDLTSPWTGTTWADTRLVQEPTANVLLNPATKPYILTLTPKVGDTSTAAAVLAAANILDGPYLNIDTTGAFLQPILADVTKPNIVSFYISFPTWNTNISYNVGQLVVYTTGAYRSKIDDNLGNQPDTSTADWESVDAGVINGAAGFTSADIGRCVRILSEPPAWDVGTTYASDAPVLYDSLYYVSLKDANVGSIPGTDVTAWIPTTSTKVARWCWGRITATDTGLNPRFTCEIVGDQLLYVAHTPGAVIGTFRLGLYGGGGGNGWPSCGVFHQGRLWLGGAVPNRFDSSMSNQFLSFSPTGPDGTVADNNAISETINSTKINQIYWMTSAGQGILCGTKGGEWLVQASALNDPISPTNIQAHQVTSYGCANILPIQTGIATVFVQKYQRKAMEFLSDVFSGKYSAPDLSEAAKHATTSKIAELAYQEELAPIIWVRTGGGGIYGITYRRTSPFITDAPSFAAWHRTVHGGLLTNESIAVGPADSASATIDVLSTVVNDAAASARHVMTQVVPMNEASNLLEAHFLDDAVVPKNCLITTVGGKLGIQIYGLWHLNGQTVSVWATGLDCGDYSVASGTCFVPFGSDATGSFTQARIQALSPQTNLYGSVISRASTGSGATSYYFPLVVGHTYLTQCQLLRPSDPADSGARNGPALGKTRRAHYVAMQVYNCVNKSIKMGVLDTNHTVDRTLRDVIFASAGGTPINPEAVFTGVIRQTLDDDYNYDTMLYWKVTRPYPMNINQVGGFLHTQDV